MMSQYDLKFDLKINAGHSYLISWSSNFACYLDAYLIYKHYTIGLWVSMTRSLTPK